MTKNATMMRLEDLSVFIQIAHHASFTEAARVLELPKTTVSRQLNRLESQLGCVLVRRTSRNVVLTDRGRALLPFARRLLDDAVEAQNVLGEDGFGAHGLLRVSCATTFGTLFLAPILPAFRLRHPRIRVQLSLNPQKVPVGAGEGKVDLAFRLGALVDSGLTVRRLGEIEFWLVASPAYLEKMAAIEVPDDLIEHDLITLFPRKGGDRLTLYRPGMTRTVAWPPSLIIDDPEAIKQAVLAGGGVASLPAFLVRREVSAGQLVRVLPDWTGEATAVSAVYDSSRPPPLRLTALLDFIVQVYGESPPWQMPSPR